MKVRTGFGICVAVLAGCRPIEVVRPGFAPPAALPAPVLAPVTPTPPDAESSKLPPADLLAPAETVFPPAPAGFRGLGAAQARDEAAKRAAGASATRGTGVLGDVQHYLAEDLRRRAADAAEDDLYALAELEAKAEILAKGLQTFDRLRAEVDKIRAAGLPAPGAEELARQRGKILAGAAAAEAGIAQRNITLKARIGYPQASPERIWPQVNLADRLTPLDGEALAAEALQTRPDLLALRAAYDGADGTLGDEVQNLLGVPDLPRRFARRVRPADPGALKALLYDAVVAKEAEVAAAARTKAADRAGAIRRAALARAAAASWRRQIADMTAKGAKPAEILAAELESLAAAAQ